MQTTTDHAAKAANDQQEAPSAPAYSKEQIERTAFEIAEALIASDTMGGTPVEIHQALAARAPGTNGAEEGLLLQAIAALTSSDNLIDRGNEDVGPVHYLTAKGIRWVMDVRKELADLALKRKEDELRAYRRRVDHEHGLVRDVQACEADVEAAKAEVSAAKERLAESNKKLAAYVAGGVQTSIIEDKPKDDGHRTAYEQGMAAWHPQHPKANPYAADPQRADWQRGYDEKRQEHEAKVAAENAPGWVSQAENTYEHHEPLAPFVMPEPLFKLVQNGAEGVSVTENIIHAFERPYLVAEQHEDLFLALPLYTKDEWGDLYEAKFGRPVEGPDQSSEAGARRTAGGDLCGRVVKVGRKKFVVGPVSDGLLASHTDGEGEDSQDGDGDGGDET